MHIDAHAVATVYSTCTCESVAEASLKMASGGISRMTCPKCNQELSRSAFYRHKNIAVCSGDDNRSVDTMPISHSEMQCSSAPSQESTISSEGCGISDGGESGPESGAESNPASTDGSEVDEVEVIANQEDTSDVVQQGATEEAIEDDSGSVQYNVPFLKRIIQALVVLLSFFQLGSFVFPKEE